MDKLDFSLVINDLINIYKIENNRSSSTKRELDIDYKFKGIVFTHNKDLNDFDKNMSIEYNGIDLEVVLTNAIGSSIAFTEEEKEIIVFNASDVFEKIEHFVTL